MAIVSAKRGFGAVVAPISVQGGDAADQNAPLPHRPGACSINSCRGSYCNIFGAQRPKRAFLEPFLAGRPPSKRPRDYPTVSLGGSCIEAGVFPNKRRKERM